MSREVPGWKSRNGWLKPGHARTFHFFVTDPGAVLPGPRFRVRRPGTVALCGTYRLRRLRHLLPVEKVEGPFCESCLRKFEEEFYDILEVLEASR